MRDAIISYRVFNKKFNSEIKNLTKELVASECNKFKGNIFVSNKNQIKYLKPNIFWNEANRSPIGFNLDTIKIQLNDLIPSGSGYKIFQHGYQSWSYSTSYAANEKDISPSLEFLRYSQENIYSNHSGKQGNFLSESFTCLYSHSTNSGFVVGVIVESDPGVRFQVQLTLEGRIEDLSAILDYHCSPNLKPNSKLSTPELIFMPFQGSPEVFIAKYFDLFSKNIEIPELSKKIPTGWCSWYYYYTNISEKIILDNLKAIQDKKLPIQFFQVDDGYQKTIGDWLTTNDDFAFGMKGIADEIKNAGYQPGIWLAPFLVRKDSEFFQKYPEAVLKDESGEPVPALWNPLWGKGYTYCLDTTHPRSKEFLTNVFKTITKVWGYPYLKLDFLYACLLPGHVYDPSLTPQMRYKEALKLIRKVVGKDTFLLGCGAPILPSVGFFQGMRISCDVAPFWKPELKRRFLKDKNALCTQKALINDITRSSMHRKFWLNDPDCLLVRKKNNSMTGKQTRIMASVMGVSGGMLLVSDDMTKLEPERIDLLEKTMALSRLCQSKTPIPIGIFESEFPEGLYNPNGYLGIWNPTNENKTIVLKLPFTPKNENWINYWTGIKDETVQWNAIENKISINLDSFDSRVFEI